MAWILKTIQELRLEPAPQVAIMPLGTGNDLSLSFGWGNTFLQKWIDVSPACHAPCSMCKDTVQAAAAHETWRAMPHAVFSPSWLACLQHARII